MSDQDDTVDTDTDSDSDTDTDTDSGSVNDATGESNATPTLADDAMANFPVPDFGELPEDLQERITEETESAGFTPNVFSAFAYKPSHFRAFFQYHDALVEDTALEREEIEMIVVAVSGVNHCYYCNVAHGALVRIYAQDPQLADQLIANYRTADINETHRTMLDVAVTLTERPMAVEESDLDRLRDAGFSEEALWDIAAVTSFYNLSNRMAMFAEMRPNDEFHTLGRD
ncbi:putative AhpD family alkylhydroperoxidase [Natrialba magadii ATCC 43099]|uniref:Peroxidase n=1 Tax=Natrialba magadii (strain ATCC 43099 / DSM 3394 / CCM 3739 / CIP 104546 / IAM 13178 / JCM 8861 / NBRC 102185 / NCIMB 2190 / MS3) TaxID=547559 RepID=D3SYC1_NATMM|nr:peroxidase-related enzyme [Natrialba magadii]ADD06092.1 putative AhpD family alkylhydroperoxidase [Natrialba magadii ATCC 43099]ELY30911.1 peroxidase [Natrialba magadii ATCC 43099]